MKKLVIIVIALISVAQAQVKKANPPKKDTSGKKVLFQQKHVDLTPPVVLKTSDDSLSYAFGLAGASYYKGQGISYLNSNLIKRAFDDVFGNKPLLLTQDQTNNVIQKRMQQIMEVKRKQDSVKIVAEKEKGKKFLAENKKRQGVVELPDGLQYEVLKTGTGEKPVDTSKVKAHYIGTLIDGKEFDNSYKRGEPLQIPVNAVIKGWTEALKLMPVGSKWKIYIPSELGYGDQGAGNGAIPGGATLIFEVELVEIVKNKQQ